MEGILPKKPFCRTIPWRSSNRKFTDNDLELIETLKASKASISMREISEILDEVGDIQGGIAMSTISRAIKSRQLYQAKNIPGRFTYRGLHSQICCIHKCS